MAGGHQAGAEAGEHFVDAPYLALEARGQSREAGVRRNVLDFHPMQHQFLRPAEMPAIDVRYTVPRRLAQQLVGNREHAQGMPVHNHIFELNALASEGREGFVVGRHGAWRLRSAMRRANTVMISR